MWRLKELALHKRLQRRGSSFAEALVRKAAPSALLLLRNFHSFEFSPASQKGANAALNPCAAQVCPGFIFSKGTAYWENSSQKCYLHFIFTCFLRQGLLVYDVQHNLSHRERVLADHLKARADLTTQPAQSRPKPLQTAATLSGSSIGQNKNLLFLKGAKGGAVCFYSQCFMYHSEDLASHILYNTAYPI